MSSPSAPVNLIGERWRPSHLLGRISQPSHRPSNPRWSTGTIVNCRRQTRFRRWPPTLNALKIRPQDVLVVYVSAHGVSEDGTPYFLCRDYDLQAPRRARYSLAQLLQEVSSCPARTKLLVLDTGWISSDPLLGMLVNEFPRLVIEQVRQWNDPGIWVLLSHGPGESSLPLPAERQTLFGQTVVAGLLGHADLPDYGGNRDSHVDLSELYRLVLTTVHGFSRAAQSPLLVRGGEGLVSVDRAPKERIVYINRQADGAASAAAAPAEATPGNGSPPGRSPENAPARPEDSASSVPLAAGAEPATSAAQPAASAAQPPSEAGIPRAATIRDSLHRAWQLRDELEEVAVNGTRWSPVEYAPHLWRELNSLLIDIDSRYRAGEAFAAGVLQAQLNAVVEGLRQLQSEQDMREVSSADLPVLGRLFSAARQFQQSAERGSFHDPSPPLRDVASAVRTCLRVEYALADYLRWHGEMSLRWPANRQLQVVSERIVTLADDLSRFREELHARRQQPLTAAATDPLVEQAGRLQRVNREILELLAEQVQVLTMQPREETHRQCIDGLLRQPLIRASQRERLAEKLESLTSDGSPAYRRTFSVPQAVSAQMPPVKWHGLFRQLQLELKWIQLAGLQPSPDFEAVLTSVAGDMQRADLPEERLWEAFRAAGAELQTAYASMPDRLRSLAADDMTHSQVIARAIDGRLSLSARWEPAEHARLFPRLEILPPQIPQRLDVVIAPDGDIRLSEQGTTVDVRIETTSSSVTTCLVTVQYNRDVLELRDAQGQTLPTGRNLPVSLDESRSAQLRWQLRPTVAAGQAAREDQRVVVSVEAGELRQQQAFTCFLPRPNEVDLIVQRVDPAEEARRLGRHGSELRPFPNRLTQFRLLLANRSGEEKTVQVALYGVPATSWVPGRLLDEYGEPFADIANSMFQPGTNRPLPGLVPWRQNSAALALPATEASVPIDLAAAPAASPVEGSAEASPAEFAPVDISSGLVVVITNVDRPNERWIKWVEINPLPPRSYLDVQSRYDRREIRVDVAFRDTTGDGQPDLFPPGLAEMPLEVSWDAGDQIPTGVEQNHRVVLTRQNPRGRLYAVVPPESAKLVHLPLQVDRYPRAFLHQVSLDHVNEGRDLRRDLRNVRIHSLAMEESPRIFLTSRTSTFGGSRESAEGAADAQPPEITFLAFGEPAYFRVPTRRNQLVVGLQIDAPLDSFTVRDHQDHVELGWVRPGLPSLQLFSDRQTRTWVTEVQGETLVVRHDVKDYEVPVDVFGLTNAAIGLRTRLVLQRDSPPPHQVDVILDADPPVIANFSAPQRAEQDTSVDVYLEVADLAGPQRVEIGWVANPSHDLKPEQAVSRESFPVRTTGARWPVSLTLPTQGMQPGTYYLKARVIDRVDLSTSQVLQPVAIVPKRQAQQATAGGAEALMGTLQGVVQFGPTFRPDGITVRIKDSSVPPAATAGGGRFRFPNLKAGTYTLEAKGAVRGYDREGTAVVELKTREDFQKQWTIPLETPRR
jgi:hypothetical protein